MEVFVREHLDKKKWKINTVSHYVTCIRSFFRFMTEKSYIQKSPVFHYTLPQEVKTLVLDQISEKDLMQLFQKPPPPTFQGYRARMLLEMVYGLGITFYKLYRI